MSKDKKNDNSEIVGPEVEFKPKGSFRQLTSKLADSKGSALKFDGGAAMSIAIKALKATGHAYHMSIKIQDCDHLIMKALKKMPVTICKHSRDSHFNNIGSDYLLVSYESNAQVLCLKSGDLLKEINLKKREMSTSIVFGDLILVGTYVDSIFAFSATTFEHLFSLRARESVICMSIVSEEDSIIAIIIKF